jgi:hypothetical protein
MFGSVVQFAGGVDSSTSFEALIVERVEFVDGGEVGGSLGAGDVVF